MANLSKFFLPPPGYRFLPYDVVLVMYYLKRKVAGRPFKLKGDIPDIALNNFSPSEVREISYPKTKDLEGFFFCSLGRRYSKGQRKNRSGKGGFWNVTGQDKPIYYKSRLVGWRTTLTFYRGKGRGTITDWRIHEYRLDDKELPIASDYQCESVVLCKIFEKKSRGPKIDEEYESPVEEDADDFVNGDDGSFLSDLPAIPSSSLGPEEGQNTVATISTLDFEDRQDAVLQPLPTHTVIPSVPRHHLSPPGHEIQKFFLNNVSDEDGNTCNGSGSHQVDSVPSKSTVEDLDTHGIYLEDISDHREMNSIDNSNSIKKLEEENLWQHHWSPGSIAGFIELKDFFNVVEEDSGAYIELEDLRTPVAADVFDQGPLFLPAPNAITYGEEGDAGPHNEPFPKWYRSITQLCIDCPTSENTHAELNTVSSQILKFTERLLASCDDAKKLEGKSSDFLSFIDGVRAEVIQLKDVCLADFQMVNLDDADAAGVAEASLKMVKGDQAEESKIKSSKKRKISSKRADNPPNPINPNSPKASQPPKRSKRLKGKSSKPPIVPKPTSSEERLESKGASSPISLSPRRSPRIVQSQLSPISPIKIRGPNDAKSSFSPFTSSPWSAHLNFSTQSLKRVKFGIELSPFSKIASMILNVKARYREPKPPLSMADYTIGAWMRNPQYKLTMEELEILTVFWNEFADKEGRIKLQEFCTPVTATNMNELLRGSWMDNWTMHYWFEMLKMQAPSSYFFECAMSDWYVHGQTSSKLIEDCFSQAFMDNVADKELLFFPVWNNQHFFLLVGRVNGRRWEYYNSMARDEDYCFAENYLTWINNRFMQYGWNDPTVWTKHHMECPMQTNSVDCGIFVMAYAQHIALGKAMGFKQSDMYYYRAKIVSDIYKDQYACWDVRKQMESRDDSSAEEL